MDANITIKNYRCFADSNPVYLEIREGFSALVGPNSSGKSSLLKFFRELRNLWAALCDPNALSKLLAGQHLDIEFNDIYDSIEVYADMNDRPITIRIDVTPENPPAPPFLKLVVLTSDRMIPKRWTATLQAVFHAQDATPRAVLSAGGSTSPNTISGKLLGSVSPLQIDCSAFQALMSDFTNMLYIGPFRNAINEGAGKYYDLEIGTSFISMWHYWKTGALKVQNQRAQQVSDDIRRIFEFSSLDISASEQLKTLQLLADGKPYKLHEVGAGISQFIIVLGNAAVKNASYVLIDEPELNLHPQLQIDFLTSLGAYAKNGVIYATHSIGLARSTADRIYSIVRTGDSSQVRPFEHAVNYAELAGELSYSTYREMGFDHLLLVEGVTDVRTYQQFLRALRVDHKVVVLPLGGDQFINGKVESELREILRIVENPAHVAVVIDSEREIDGGIPKKNHAEFAELCTTLGFNVLLTERRATENYFVERAIRSVLGEGYPALAPYEPLKGRWKKAENWRIAREMSKEELAYTDVGRFLQNLGARI